MKLERENVLSVLGQSYTGHLGFGDLAQQLGVAKRDHVKLRALLGELVDAGDVDEVGQSG